ncbi:hypothetical protein IWQ61_010395 [Dispira simplex]|nr:hypothetical protein IWQ61_010395 [Dispira simplex]
MSEPNHDPIPPIHLGMEEEPSETLMAANLEQVLAQLTNTLKQISARPEPRHPNLGNPNFPLFAGQPLEDVRKWVKHIEMHLVANGAHEDQCVPFAMQYLKGMAWDWFHLHHEQGNSSLLQWSNFRTALIEHFQSREDDLLLRD